MAPILNCYWRGEYVAASEVPLWAWLVLWPWGQFRYRIVRPIGAAIVRSRKTPALRTWAVEQLVKTGVSGSDAYHITRQAKELVDYVAGGPD